MTRQNPSPPFDTEYIKISTYQLPPFHLSCAVLAIAKQINGIIANVVIFLDPFNTSNTSTVHNPIRTTAL
jgi:hypothetical protein